MTILSRHHTLLKELQIADRCFVTSVLFVDDLMPAPPAEPTLLPRASRWCTLPPDEDEDMGIAVYASEISHPSEELDVVLRAVVDEQLAGVIIIPPDADCLYHPYDGGADVIAGSPQARDELVRSSTRGCRLIHEVCSRAATRRRLASDSSGPDVRPRPSH